MNSFALCPLQAGYSFTPANNMVEQQLIGGFARQRSIFVNNVHVASASVMLNTKAKHQYFWAFWRAHTLNPKPFLWKLWTDWHEMQTHTCQFVGDSLTVNERNGTVVSVSFQVRCNPLNNGDLAFDDAIVSVWETGNGADFTNLLEQLANIDLPNALESV